MPTTPTWSFPYPAPSSAPDVPYDIQQLAEAVEARLKGAWIHLGAATITSSTTINATTAVDVPGLEVTVDVPRANMKLRISLNMMLKGSVTGDRGIGNINEGSTILQSAQLPAFSGINTGHQLASFVEVINPSVGSHTYKVQIARLTGTGNVNVSASSGVPAILTVDACDI